MTKNDPVNKVSEPLKRREFLRMTAQAAALALGATGRRSLLAAAESTSTIKASVMQQSPAFQIGIFLGTFRRETLEARLDAVKACGLDCVHVGLDCAGLPAMPDEIPPDVPGRIRRAATERGMTISSAQGTFNMTHPDAEYRRRGLRQLRALAESCPQMGTSIIHLCTGTRDRNSLWRRHPDNDTPAAWQDMTACVREACDIAKQARVVLAFEPEINNVVNSSQKARRLIDEIGSPFLKVTIDPANLFPAGQLPRMREILDEAFALVGKDVVLAHAKDLDHDGDAGHLAAGQGKLDYDRYLALLRGQRLYSTAMLSISTV
jgi:sugar phosphate isomerase/epimerase